MTEKDTRCSDVRSAWLRTSDSYVEFDHEPRDWNNLSPDTVNAAAAACSDVAAKLCHDQSVRERKEMSW
jgi:hypothetical protein